MSVYAVPQIPTPPDTDDITALREYIQQLANVTAMAMKELDWLLNGNMDVKNIRANSIVAKLINVDQLSAISADMGTVTAGTIIGAFIETAISGQRLELDVNGLRSYDVNNLKRLSITPSTAREIGMAGFEAFDSIGAYGGVIFGVTGGKMWVLGENGLIISSWFGQTTIRDYVDFAGAIISGLDISDVTNLQSSLDAKATKNVSTSSTSASDSHNHGLTSSDYIQCYDSAGVATSKKQWVPYAGSAAHSHTQN